MTRTAPQRRRRSRTSCSVIALATVMAVGATPAAAQSLLGTGTYVTNPNATGITTGANLTTINLNGGQTVIDWTPTDNATGTGTNINFQPAGTTALFTGGSDFAVLNRVLPADFNRAIVMNGTVNAQVGGSQRGSVYFYSPSGFVFGGSSVFNVGSLVVTTSPITLSGGNFITGNTVVFGQALNPNAAIVSGSTINASSAPIGVIPPGQSYVAMVAPRVIQTGTIIANGSTALVAAEAATINFSPDGLFDIQVSVGTTSTEGINVTGNIGGPAPTSAADTQGVYLVAVPKNDALTMVIGNGADLGFTLANNATVDAAGAVVLSAGHDIVDGQIAARSAGHGASATGNFIFTGAHATNNVVAEATGTAQIYSVSPNLTTTFDSDLTVHAAGNILVSSSGANALVSVAGDLSLSTNRTAAAGQSVIASNVQIAALNTGVVSVSGTTNLSANGTGGDASSGSAGSGTGGTIWVSNDDGGSVSLAALSATATGTGGDGLAAGVNAGQGTGGTLRVYSDDTGSVVVNGALSLNAQGTGGDASGAGLAGTGQGGRAYVYVGDDASVTINGSTMMASDGQGGAHATGNGGAGTGGESRVTAVDPSSIGGVITFNGNTTLSSDGTGGASGGAGTGGTGTGGWARISTPFAHDVAVNGTAYLHALGNGGGSSTGAGGIGQGGTAELVGLLGDIDISSTVTVSSSGQGGSGALGGSGRGGFSSISSQSDIALTGDTYIYAMGDGGSAFDGNGGSGTGGTILVEADGGILSLGSLYADARGRGGYTDSGFTSGAGQGGDIYINALADSSLAITNALNAYADGIGGETPWLDVNGGDGFGGYIGLGASGSNASITVGGNSYLRANGEAGYAGECSICGGLGGQGIGGEIFVTASGTGATLTLASVDAYASGYGGLGIDADGGYGEGGFVQFGAFDGGSLALTGYLFGSANGYGGDQTEGGYGGDGIMHAGDGVGGTVEILTSGTGTPRINVSSWADIEADGYGGDVFSPFQLFQDGGQGPAAAEGDVRGGDGTGGRAGIYSNAGKFSDDDNPANDGGITIGSSAYVSGDGFGGDTGNGYGGGISGGIGGDGYGTNGEIFANGGDVDIAGWAYVSANGSGGYGDFGGDGFGGEALDPNPGAGADGAHLLSRDGTLRLGGAFVSADGYGADGGNGYFYGGGTGGSGGNGTGGTASVFAANSDNGPSLIYISDVESSLTVSANGYGGDGDSGYDGLNGLDGIAGGGGSIGQSGEDGTDGADGGAGGAGGNGTGGAASVSASSGNGEIYIQSAYVSASGFGGAGGDGGSGGFGGWGGEGGNGDAGAGGDGGNGGNGGSGGIGGAGGSALAGRVTIGTLSGVAQATADNLGLATFGNATIEANATGGTGGGGGSSGAGGIGGLAGSGDPGGQAGTNGGNGTDGNGGDGGAAVAGAATLLVRGSTVDILGTASLSTNAYGGDGGFGGGEFGIQGDGGNATVGGDELGMGILVTPRNQFPAQTGTLNAGTVIGSAVADGGGGSVDGSGLSLGQNGVMFENGTGTIGLLDFIVDADGVGPGAFADMVSLVGSDLTVGSFSFSTVGDLSLFVDNGEFNVGTLTLTAGNFVHDGATPTNLGTTIADDVFITTGDDFIADTNWDVTNTFNVYAPGSIDVDNVQDDNGIDFFANESIVTGTLDAGSYVELFAYDFVSAGDIDAGSSVDILAYFGSINVGEINAGSFVSLSAGTFINGADINAGGSIFGETFGGNIDLGNLTSTFGEITLDSDGDIFLDGDALADGDIELTAEGNILTGNLSAGQNIGLAAPGTITAGDINAGGIFMALGHGDMLFGDATAAEVFLSDYAILNLGGLTAMCVGACGSLGADGVVVAPPTGPSYSYVTTDGGVDGAGQLPGVGGTNGTVYTTSEFEVGAGEALEFWFNYVTSDGSGFADYAWAGLYTPDLDPVAILFTARTQPDGTIVPGQGLPGVEATLNPPSVPIIDGGPVWNPLGADSGACYAAGCGYTGWISSSYDIAEAGSYVLRFGVTNWTDTGYQSGMAFSGLSIGGVSATPTLLTPTGGSITIGNVNTGKFSAAAGTSLTTGVINSTGSIGLGANGAITTGNLFAGDFVLANGGSITTGNIEADSVDMTSTGGNIATGDILAFDAVEMDAFGDITSGDILAGSIDLLAGDDITTGDLSTQLILQLAQEGGPGKQFLYPGASITLEAGGDISTGNIDSIDGVFADAGGTLTTGTIAALDFVELYSVANMQTAAITAGEYIYAESGAGIGLGALQAGGDIELDAIGNATFVSAQAAGEFDFSVGGSLTGGNVIAGNEISGESGATVSLGNLTAGLPLDDDFSVGILAATGITVGNVNAAGPAGFATTGNLTTGNIVAGDGVLALVGGNVTMGSITTNGEGGGQVYIGDDSMFFAAGGTPDGEGDFDASLVLGVAPVPTGGSITINGPVNTGLFRAAAGTSLVTQAITADEIEARALGTAAINGIWTAPLVTLASNDINITGTGGIAAGAGGEINLLSSNDDEMLIGDGLTGTGYALSNAEFSRISAGDINIIAGAFPDAAADTRIGNLTITAGSTGNIRSTDGGLAIIGLNEAGTERDGSMRVVGNVSGTGFTNTNYLAFATETFELDAATGSISLTSSGSTLSGELDLFADRIHIASGAILDQLENNPTYSGYQQDLNEAATVQRPEGVLRVGTLWIESDNLQDVLIQNTGTTATPAGFLVNEAFINDDEEVAGPPSSINLVVNGQVITEGGTLTGIAARDALTEDADLTPFTANSTINGCPLTGACIIQPDQPLVPPTVVDDQIDLIGGNPLGDDEFDDNQEGEEGSNNPISPPQPLFDTRPLIPDSDVNDPVSGTGNPSLMGGDDCKSEDESQCATEKGDGQ